MKNLLTLELPPEFIDLCEQYGTTPEQALRWYIADLCGLATFPVSNPRGYAAGTHDDRLNARAHFHHEPHSL